MTTSKTPNRADLAYLECNKYSLQANPIEGASKRNIDQFLSTKFREHGGLHYPLPNVLIDNVNKALSVEEVHFLSAQSIARTQAWVLDDVKRIFMPSPECLHATISAHTASSDQKVFGLTCNSKWDCELHKFCMAVSYTHLTLPTSYPV